MQPEMNKRTNTIIAYQDSVHLG